MDAEAEGVYGSDPAGRGEGAMRGVWNPRFDEERRRFDLRACCEDCAYFVPENGSCAHRFPNGEHRRAWWDRLREGEHVVFCKDFESA